jgi:6-phosphogluconolactonase
MSGSLPTARFADLTALAAAAAGDMFLLLEQTLSRQPTVTVALSGGRIAPPLFKHLMRHLASHPPCTQRIHWFWADERLVPPDHPDSNYALAHRLFLEPLGIPPTHRHRVPTELPPLEAARYTDGLLRHCAPVTPQEIPALDLVWLGMGEDGHIASLFPDREVQVPFPTAAYGVVSDAPKPPPLRVTLTWPALTAAKYILVLVAGPGKTSALNRACQGDPQVPLGRLLLARPDTRLYVQDPADNP